jgi:hypothetical protein
MKIIAYLNLKIYNDEQDYFHNDAGIHGRDRSGKLSPVPFVGIQCFGIAHDHFVFVHCVLYLRIGQTWPEGGVKITFCWVYGLRTEGPVPDNFGTGLIFRQNADILGSH